MNHAIVENIRFAEARGQERQWPAFREDNGKDSSQCDLAADTEIAFEANRFFPNQRDILGILMEVVNSLNGKVFAGTLVRNKAGELQCNFGSTFVKRNGDGIFFRKNDFHIFRIQLWR